MTEITSGELSSMGKPDVTDQRHQPAHAAGGGNGKTRGSSKANLGEANRFRKGQAERPLWSAMAAKRFDPRLQLTQFELAAHRRFVLRCLPTGVCRVGI